MASDIFEPDLRIFLSVDLIGSTAFKQLSATTDKSADQCHSWLISFFDFYFEFRIVFQSVLDRHKSHYGVDEYEKPQLWKRLGDELLFSAPLRDTKHAIFFVECFRTALVEYEKNIQKQNWPLGLKGTAWTAGFPVRNVKIPADADGDSSQDYIGPCIDLGFRLTKFSSHRKLVLSVELVWLILSFLDEQQNFAVYYDGKSEVKGFKGGSYPIFWISKSGKRENDKEMLLLNLHPCEDNSHVASFCHGFICSSSNDLQIPFIVGADALSEYVPVEYSLQCEAVKRMQRGNYYSANADGETEDNTLTENTVITDELLDSIPLPPPSDAS